MRNRDNSKRLIILIVSGVVLVIIAIVFIIFLNMDQKKEYQFEPTERCTSDMNIGEYISWDDTGVFSIDPSLLGMTYEQLSEKLGIKLNKPQEYDGAKDIIVYELEGGSELFFLFTDNKCVLIQNNQSILMDEAMKESIKEQFLFYESDFTKVTEPITAITYYTTSPICRADKDNYTYIIDADIGIESNGEFSWYEIYQWYEWIPDENETTAPSDSAPDENPTTISEVQYSGSYGNDQIYAEVIETGDGNADIFIEFLDEEKNILSSTIYKGAAENPMSFEANDGNGNNAYTIDFLDDSIHFTFHRLTWTNELNGRDIPDTDVVLPRLSEQTSNRDISSWTNEMIANAINQYLDQRTTYATDYYVRSSEIDKNDYGYFVHAHNRNGDSSSPQDNYVVTWGGQVNSDDIAYFAVDGTDSYCRFHLTDFDPDYTASIPDHTSATINIPDILSTTATIPDDTNTNSVLETGTCGDGVTYIVYSDGTAVISGNGTMYRYQDTSKVFSQYAAVTSIIIEDGVQDIGRWAFQGCVNLESVTIGNGVEQIHDYSFYYCSKLKKVTIPASVKSIDQGAFFGCKISEVYYTGSESEWNAVSIGDKNDPLLNAAIHFGN